MKERSMLRALIADTWGKVKYYALGVILLLVVLGVLIGKAMAAERELRVVSPPPQMSMPCAYWTELVLWLAEAPRDQRAGRVFALRGQSRYLYAFAVDAARWLEGAQGDIRAQAMKACGEWQEL